MTDARATHMRTLREASAARNAESRRKQAERKRVEELRVAAEAREAQALATEQARLRREFYERQAQRDSNPTVGRAHHAVAPGIAYRSIGS